MRTKKPKHMGLGFGKRFLINTSLIVVLLLIIFVSVQPGTPQYILVGLVIFISLQFTNMLDKKYRNK